MSRVNNHIDYVEFPAKNVEELGKVKEFFGEVFGWSYTMYGDEWKAASMPKTQRQRLLPLFMSQTCMRRITK